MTELKVNQMIYTQIKQMTAGHSLTLKGLRRGGHFDPSQVFSG